MKEENNNKPEELWETPMFNEGARKVEFREAYNRNVKNCEESGFIQRAS